MPKIIAFRDASETFGISDTGGLMLREGGPIEEGGCVVSSVEVEDFAHWILDTIRDRRAAEAEAQSNG